MTRGIKEAWSKFVQPVDGCWNWKASVGSHGYGQLTYLQQKYTAHRLSWELHRGPIPDGLCVLHRCDNRRCVNPDHLFLGTKPENLQDMTNKGRRVRGDRHGQAKITEADARIIKASNLTQKELAQQHGVCTETISNIQRGRRWSHL